MEAGTSLAKAFKADVHHVTTLIDSHTDMGAPAVSGCRYSVMDRFPYGIAYRYKADALTIIAIVRPSRRRGLLGRPTLSRVFIETYTKATHLYLLLSFPRKQESGMPLKMPLNLLYVGLFH
jgi:hypothetical protein